MSTVLTYERCRHCGARIEPCDCGASGRPHWRDRAYRSRWCVPYTGKLHESARTITAEDSKGDER